MTQMTHRRLPWEMVAGMKIRPDQSVPRGTMLVNPDDYRVMDAAAYDIEGERAKLQEQQ